MPGPLKNGRWERFAQGLARGETADAAYQAAGYKPNRHNASRLKTNETILSRVAELQQEIAKRTVVDAAWLLDRLAAEVDADVAELYDEAGNLKAPKDWPPIFRKGLVAGLDIEEVREDGKTTATVRKIRLSDRVKRLELIGKHVAVQAFRDNVAHTGDIKITISSDDAEL
ncbi:MAG: terminase small subunit [Alphaproteobacteria bacterium]|nr:terminase small subunit [Alphaproteobacteria bacterium]